MVVSLARVVVEVTLVWVVVVARVLVAARLVMVGEGCW